ncbi:MarR family transcriptional regulator [Phenylobacterium hankyongense]|uniref:MarR family transcriptional regulator n=1 Tax=Phenylobacterium hankyongense TaxID=1813876 RepID=A0A328AYS0_9CAUL|nr:MarR family transcriptional regulator [Phenylobacterium hankyongense]RAK59445.1 MarR family transcriptional regulator [Phenylobacterium hankyongense]
MQTCEAERDDEDVCGVLTQGLILVGRRWRTRLNERLKAIGQTDARCAALAEIARAPQGMPQRELSERLGVEEPTVVRLVDALEAQGWVERRARADDRRVKVLVIKPSAMPVLRQAKEIVTGLEQEMFAEMSADDLASCVMILRRLSGRLARV